jgi:hypothetical protein
MNVVGFRRDPDLISSQINDCGGIREQGSSWWWVGEKFTALHIDGRAIGTGATPPFNLR